MHQRIEALRAGLAKTSSDSYLSFSPPANQYLSAFTGTTSVLIVTNDKAIFLCDSRYTEQARDQVKSCEVHEVAGVMETRAAEWLIMLGAKNTAFDPVVMTVQQLKTVQETHSGAFTPDTRLLSSLRALKSADEIDKLRAATQLAETAFLNVKSELKAGIAEREFAAKLEYEFKRLGAQGSSFDPIVLFGARSSLPHGRPSGKTLEVGDVVLLDFGCILDGYCSDLTRCFAFGTIPAPCIEEIYSVCLAAQCAAVDAIRGGAMAKDVDAVARDAIKDAGFGDFFGHGLGHGVGLEVHESPRLNPLSETTLQAGMVVTVEPGIYLPGKGGIRIEDLVVVTEDGCDVLTKLPKELEVLGT